MTSIKDLEIQIEGAEDALAFAKGELAELKANLQELKEQEKDKEPESLFGRWATLPKYGRGIITSIKPDSTGEVRFVYRNESFTDSTEWIFASVEHLTLDPATLTTAEDFEDAPEGTVVETGDMKICHKIEKNAWLHSGSETVYTHLGMASLAECTPCRAIRWGNGQ